MCRESIIPYSTEIHRRDQGHWHIIGCNVGENIDNYWNVDGDRELSDTWTSFTRFTILDEKTLEGYAWSEGARPDTLWPEIWKDMSETSKRKEKQKWTIEKPRLDNARQLRGIYFIDPADEEYKDIMKKRV